MRSRVFFVFGVLFILAASVTKTWAGDGLFPIKKSAQNLKITYTREDPLRKENRRLVEKAVTDTPGKRFAVREVVLQGGGGYVDEFDIRSVKALKIRLGPSIQWIDVSYPNRPIESFGGDGRPIRD